MARVFDRLGFAAHDWQIHYAAGLLNFRQRVLLGVDMAEPSGYERVQVITRDATGGQITAEEFDRISTSITREDHAGH